MWIEEAHQKGLFNADALVRIFCDLYVIRGLINAGEKETVLIFAPQNLPDADKEVFRKYVVNRYPNVKGDEISVKMTEVALPIVARCIMVQQVGVPVTLPQRDIAGTLMKEINDRLVHSDE